MAVELVRDGEPLPIELRLTPITDADGATLYILAEGRFEPKAPDPMPV
jgi:hypothetical protein